MRKTIVCEECGREEHGRDPALWRRSHGLDSALLCSPCYAAGGIHGAGPHGDKDAEGIASAYDSVIATCKASGSQMPQSVHDYLEMSTARDNRAIEAYEARIES